MHEPTGIDLARQMFNAARAEARKHGGRPAAKRAKSRPLRARGDGREPVKLGAAIDELAERFGWSKPSAGARVVIGWGELVPDLADMAAPERYDADTRTLYLRPASPAAATHLRLLAAGLPARLNEAGADTVQTVRVLAPGPLPGCPATPIPATPPAPDAPVRTRETASYGYHQALAAHQQAKPDRQDLLPTAVRTAIASQDHALRQRREPEEAFADARELLEDLQRRAEAATDPHARALARARAEKTGRGPAIPRAFDRTA